MSDDVLTLWIIYGVVTVLWLLVSLEWYNHRDADVRRDGARGLLALPVWPLVALYLLLRYGVPAAGRGFGRLMVEATRRGDGDE